MNQNRSLSARDTLFTSPFFPPVFNDDGRCKVTLHSLCWGFYTEMLWAASRISLVRQKFCYIGKEWYPFTFSAQVLRRSIWNTGWMVHVNHSPYVGSRCRSAESAHQGRGKAVWFCGSALISTRLLLRFVNSDFRIERSWHRISSTLGPLVRAVLFNWHSFIAVISWQHYLTRAPKSFPDCTYFSFFRLLYKSQPIGQRCRQLMRILLWRWTISHWAWSALTKVCGSWCFYHIKCIDE